jgi:hypothetical protein
MRLYTLDHNHCRKFKEILTFKNIFNFALALIGAAGNIFSSASVDASLQHIPEYMIIYFINISLLYV